MPNKHEFFFTTTDKHAEMQKKENLFLFVQ